MILVKRWLPQLIELRKYKDVFISVKFTNAELKFSMLVAESFPQHRVGTGCIRSLVHEEVGDMNSSKECYFFQLTQSSWFNSGLKSYSI